MTSTAFASALWFAMYALPFVMLVTEPLPTAPGLLPRQAIRRCGLAVLLVSLGLPVIGGMIRGVAPDGPTFLVGAGLSAAMLTGLLLPGLLLLSQSPATRRHGFDRRTAPRVVAVAACVLGAPFFGMIVGCYLTGSCV